MYSASPSVNGPAPLQRPSRSHQPASWQRRSTSPRAARIFSFGPTPRKKRYPSSARRRRSAGGSASRSFETVKGSIDVASSMRAILPGHAAEQLREERPSLVRKMPLQLRGAVAFAARPRLLAIEVATLVASVRVLHADELEILLPVRPLLVQRHVAEADLDP